MDSMLHLTPSHASLPDGFSVQLISSSLQPPLPLSPCQLSTCLAAVVWSAAPSLMPARSSASSRRVVNHGICEETLRDMEAVCDEFFRLPAEDKKHIHSDDKSRPNRLFSGSTYKTSSKMYWMDCLRLTRTFPISESKNNWPDKPQRLREVFENFTEQTRGLGMELLQMLCESMELRPGYFDGDLSGGDTVLSVNRYPPCPVPSKTLGLPPHCDRNLLTLVLSGTVPGLEVFYNGDWIKVEPMANAFVVNFGLQIEVVTNGMLKSVEHRVVTNKALVRTSVVTTIHAAEDCLLGPAKELLSESNPASYHTMLCRDIMRIYNQSLEQSEGDMKHHMKPFRI
ncbi:unnamed protein product [Urochloa humidicola]